MAKRKPKKELKFYESLAVSPRDMGLGVGDSLGDLNQRIPWGQWRDRARAAGHDAVYGAKRVLGSWRDKRVQVSALVVATLFFAGGAFAAVNMGLSAMNTYGNKLSSATTIMNSKNTGTT